MSIDSNGVVTNEALARYDAGIKDIIAMRTAEKNPVRYKVVKSTSTGSQTYSFYKKDENDTQFVVDSASDAITVQDSIDSTSKDPVNGVAVAAKFAEQMTTQNINSIIGYTPMDSSIKGAANGVASLDGLGQVPTSQLPLADSYSPTGTKPVTGTVVAAALATLPEPMVFKGTVGTGGTVTSLPTAATSNKGHTYKAITANVTSGSKIGDTFISNGSEWVIIPSGDEPSGTVTQVGINASSGSHLSASGTVNSSGNLTVGVESGYQIPSSSDVSQITTNKTNILYGLRKVGTNMFNFEAWANNATVTKYGTKSVSENTITISATNNSDTYTEYSENRYPVDARIPVNAGDKLYMSWDYSSADNVTGNVYIFGNAGTSSMANANATDGHLEYTVPASGISYITMRVGLGSNQSGKSGTWSNIQIIMKSAYDSGLTNFTPYALPNYDLTRLQAEDRAALAEEIDAGAKNIISGNWYNSSGDPKLTFTANSDGSLTISKSAATSAAVFISAENISMTSAQYVCSLVTANSNILLQLRDSSGNTTYGLSTSNTPFTIPNTSNKYKPMIRIDASATFSNVTVKPMICTKAAFGVSQKFVPFGTDPFYQVPINHNMIYRGRNLGATLTDAQHTALSSGNFTDLYLGDYWTKTVTIPAGTYTGGDGEEVTVPAQTNITLKAVIADFDTFYAGYASTYAGINTHHAAVIVTGFSNVVWNKTNSTAGGYVASLIHKWLVGSVLPQIETWFGSAKVLSHQKLLTNAVTGDAASGWAWSSQKISLLTENQMYGSKVWGNSKATNGGYEPGEAFKHLNVFNHIDANLLFGNKSIWLRDIASAVGAANLYGNGYANRYDASYMGIAPAVILLS